MMNEPLIRFAKKEDLIDLVLLCELHAIFEKSSFDATGKAEHLGKHLFSNTPSLYCLIVENENKILGYATYMKQFSTWDASFYIYMDCIFLKEESRGYGLGEKLIDKIKEEGRKFQCTHIQWQTPDFNTRAIKFYDRIGATAKAKERFFLDI